MLCFALVTLLGLAWGAEVGNWQDGRATFYGTDDWSIHKGSCGYGNIYPDEPLGWDVAAMADVDPEYSTVGQCGRCYEVMCRPSRISDNYGGSFDRSSVCFDSSSSVVVRITDTCPCVYPNNAWSNKRWCCMDRKHLDLSVWTFEKLADKKWGVIGIKYRSVPCSHQPQRSVVQAPDVSPAPALPPKPMIVRDWPEFHALAEDPATIYRGGLFQGWSDISYNVQTKRDSGIGPLNGVGAAGCVHIQPKGAIALKATTSAPFDKRVSLVLWVYVGDFRRNNQDVWLRRNLNVLLAGPQGFCSSVNLRHVNPTGFKPTCTYCETYWYRFEIHFSAFAGFDANSLINNPQFFEGCGSMKRSELTTVEIRNYESSALAACVDNIELK